MSAVFTRLAPLRVAKYALGGLLASFFAAMLGLSYSTSAGVIAILSIQTTRKQTLALVVRRFAAFFAAMALAWPHAYASSLSSALCHAMDERERMPGFSLRLLMPSLFVIVWLSFADTSPK